MFIVIVVCCHVEVIIIIIFIIIISCYPFRDIGRQQNVAIWSYFWPAA